MDLIGGLMKARLFPVVMIPLLVLLFSVWAVAGTAHGKPKLVLQITIDQMRGDFPMRYKDRLGESGFRYLMETTTKIAAIHCSPWTYDTYVPLFFAGYGIPSQRIARPVTPYDIAATIAIYLEIKPPSGSVGIPLVEVLAGK